MDLESVRTILLILVFVVPGFLLRAGYLRSRARTTPDADLYALAEAVTGSLFLLALLWPWRGRDILAWAREHTLGNSDHVDSTFWFLLVLFGGAYPIGLMAGWLVDWLTSKLEAFRLRHAGAAAEEDSRYVRFFRFLDRSGIVRHPTVWDDTWLRMRAEKRFWVRVRTTTGEEVIGFFADQSRVGTSPAPRQLYLEQIHHKNDDGSYTQVKNGRGIYIDSEHIAAIEFAAFDS